MGVSPRGERPADRRGVRRWRDDSSGVSLAMGVLGRQGCEMLRRLRANRRRDADWFTLHGWRWLAAERWLDSGVRPVPTALGVDGWKLDVVTSRGS